MCPSQTFGVQFTSFPLLRSTVWQALAERPVPFLLSRGSNEIALSALGVPDEARVLNAFVVRGPAPEVVEEWSRDPLGESGPEIRQELEIVSPVSLFTGRCRTLSVSSDKSGLARR